MSKEEIKNLLIEFVCEYDFTNWNNDKVYEKFSDLIYKQISDLEAKLAESEERAERNKSWYNEKAGECAELKQQLAEKEKENELMAKTLKMTKFVEKEINQAKISFAVEQINKIKNDLYENEKINIRACDFDEIDNIFDNQIKQLKEMK